jgi:hypothetical protein
MKVNPKAAIAVLKALQKNCYDDMADEDSSPEEKMADAVEETEDSLTSEEVDEDDLMADDGDAIKAEPDEEDPIKAALKDFMRTKTREPRPGTAVMLAVDSKKTMPKRKSIKDMI